MIEEAKLKPTVLWFTGLSGSGKSTISEKVYAELKERGLKVEHLDGDAVREVFPTTGFSKEERDSHVKRVGFAAVTETWRFCGSLIYFSVSGCPGFCPRYV